MYRNGHHINLDVVTSVIDDTIFFVLIVDHHEIVTDRDVNVADKFGDFWDGKFFILFPVYKEKY